MARCSRPSAAASVATSGYSGRVGIFELLVTTEEVRQLAHDSASTWEIKKAAVARRG